VKCLQSPEGPTAEAGPSLLLLTPSVQCNTGQRCSLNPCGISKPASPPVGHGLAPYRNTNSRPESNQLGMAQCPGQPVLPAAALHGCGCPTCRAFGVRSGICRAGCKDVAVCRASCCSSLPLDPDEQHPRQRENMC